MTAEPVDASPRDADNGESNWSATAISEAAAAVANVNRARRISSHPFQS
jgi:hypothetical protein